MKKTLRFGFWLSIPVCAAVVVPVGKNNTTGNALIEVYTLPP